MKEKLFINDVSFQRKPNKHNTGHTVLRLRMMKGSVCDKFLNATLLEKFLNEFAINQSVRTIWENWRTIMLFLKTKNPPKRDFVSKIWNNKLVSINNLMSNFGKSWDDAFGDDLFVKRPFYVHVLVKHVPKFLKNYGSLVPFSTQSLERQHRVNIWLWGHTTNQGGGRKKKQHSGTTITIEQVEEALVQETRNKAVSDKTKSILRTIFLRQFRILDKVLQYAETREKFNENTIEFKRLSKLVDRKRKFKMWKTCHLPISNLQVLERKTKPLNIIIKLVLNFKKSSLHYFLQS